MRNIIAFGGECWRPHENKGVHRPFEERLNDPQGTNSPVFKDSARRRREVFTQRRRGVPWDIFLKCLRVKLKEVTLFLKVTLF